MMGIVQVGSPDGHKQHFICYSATLQNEDLQATA